MPLATPQPHRRPSPRGVQVATSNVFDVSQAGIDGMLQTTLTSDSRFSAARRRVPRRSGRSRGERLAAAMHAAVAPFVGPLTALDVSSRDAMNPELRDRSTTMFLESLRAGPDPA